jgi:hypothetical protein
MRWNNDSAAAPGGKEVFMKPHSRSCLTRLSHDKQSTYNFLLTSTV